MKLPVCILLYNHKEYHNGNTALIYAASLGHSRIVEELLSRGADIYIVNKENLTALQAAIENNHAEVEKIFFDQTKKLVFEGLDETNQRLDIHGIFPHGVSNIVAEYLFDLKLFKPGKKQDANEIQPESAPLLKKSII